MNYNTRSLFVQTFSRLFQSIWKMCFILGIKKGEGPYILGTFEDLDSWGELVFVTDIYTFTIMFTSDDRWPVACVIAYSLLPIWAPPPLLKVRMTSFGDVKRHTGCHKLKQFTTRWTFWKDIQVPKLSRLVYMYFINIKYIHCVYTCTYVWIGTTVEICQTRLVCK